MGKFVVEDSFWKLLLEVEIGIVCVGGILPTDQISKEGAARAAKLLDVTNNVAERWLTSTTISRNEIVAVWRQAYQKFKTKKGARCSVENLLKRVLKDNPVGHINPAVDVSNAISLKYALPIDAENLDAVEGTFRLVQTEGGDRLLPIGEEESDPTLPGEVAYLDDGGAICRCWNWRDAQRTEVSDATPHCVFIMENVDPSRSADLHAASDEVARLAAVCCVAPPLHQTLQTMSEKSVTSSIVRATASSPHASVSVKCESRGLSMSSMPTTLSHACSGTAISEFEALSQVMCPGNRCTSFTSWVPSVAAAVPQTPRPRSI